MQRRFTQINDIGLGYYMTYEYMPGRFLTGKGNVIVGVEAAQDGRALDVRA